MTLHLSIWRQEAADRPGRLVDYTVHDVVPDMSLLETLDKLNQELVAAGEEPVAFDHDCREGICGSCGMVIDGVAHGPERATATCQLYMRKFRSGDHLVLEPWRARALPVIRDLVVDRSALDRIIQAGGYVSVNTGNAVDANTVLVAKDVADEALDAAQCIGCGACVAACPNASAMLFVAAKVAHLGVLPQGRPEHRRRVGGMVAAMDHEGFGSCSNHHECEAVCPKSISVRFITRLNGDYLRGVLGREE